MAGSRGGLIERVCQHVICGRVFFARRTDLKRKPTAGRFCSRRCLSSANAALVHARYPQTGASNFNFKGWASLNKRAYVDRFRAKYPEKARAHDLVKNALEAGRLVKPSHCADCHHEKFLHSHHEDYSRPLDVVWLCVQCHRARHLAKAS
jgi:hypothetical protein